AQAHHRQGRWVTARGRAANAVTEEVSIRRGRRGGTLDGPGGAGGGRIHVAGPIDGAHQEGVLTLGEVLEGDGVGARHPASAVQVALVRHARLGGAEGERGAGALRGARRPGDDGGVRRRRVDGDADGVGRRAGVARGVRGGGNDG